MSHSSFGFHSFLAHGEWDKPIIITTIRPAQKQNVDTLRNWFFMQSALAAIGIKSESVGTAIRENRLAQGTISGQQFGERERERERERDAIGLTY